MKDGTNLYIFFQTNAYFLKNLHGGGDKMRLFYVVFVVLMNDTT